MNLKTDYLIVPRTPRNGRIYSSYTTGVSSSSIINSNAVDLSWVTVTDTLLTLDRDLYVNGNISASKDVIAWLTSAVSGGVLTSISATAPLSINSSGSSISLLYDTAQFQLSSGNTLQINSSYLSSFSGSTGSTSGVTKTSIGLGNVDNTSDVNKPVSTVQQSALNLKADLTGATFTGTINNNLSTVGVGTVSNAVSGYTVTGVGTTFLTSFNINDSITIGANTVTITGIISDTIINTTQILAAHSASAYSLTGGEKFNIKPNGNINATVFKIRNSSGVVKWSITVDSSDNLQFINASGVLEATLSQSGALKAKGDITAFATI